MIEKCICLYPGPDWVIIGAAGEILEGRRDKFNI